MDRKILAIGGGDIAALGQKSETYEINKEIVELSEKTNPNLLFIPTASSDSAIFYENIKIYFKKEFNCNVDRLQLIEERPTFDEIKCKIDNADIIYVGGGNTLKMMTIWRRIGVDKLLIEAYEKGKVMCGSSAGGICWFEYGNSDSRKFTSNSNKLIKVSGLGVIKALNCPHYGQQECREQSLKEMMKKVHKIVAIGVDEGVAIEIINDTYRIITSNENHFAYKVYWKNNQYHKEKIACDKQFQNLSKLLKK